jgi:RecA-family ATPase
VDDASTPKIDLEALLTTKDYTYQVKDQLLRLHAVEEARQLLDIRRAERVLGHHESPIGLVYDPLPDSAPELIPGLLPQRGAAAIVGETNTGKSLIALEIGASLLTGEPLWGKLEPTKQIKRMTYVLGEHTCSTIRGLYHKTQLPHAGDFRLIGPEHLHPYKALVIGGIAQQMAIDRLIKWCEGSELIVFDPLAGFIQGLGAEQDNASMRTLIDSMSYIAEAVGSACLILSHMGKPRIDEAGAEIRRTSYAMRGASAQEDALTYLFYLRRDSLVKQQGPQERYALSVRKIKGDPSMEVFKLTRDPETKRNWLTGSEKAQSLPTLEDKMALAEKVQRLRETNPRYDERTCIENVAAM